LLGAAAVAVSSVSRASRPRALPAASSAARVACSSSCRRAARSCSAPAAAPRSSRSLRSSAAACCADPAARRSASSRTPAAPGRGPRSGRGRRGRRRALVDRVELPAGLALPGHIGFSCGGPLLEGAGARVGGRHGLPFGGDAGVALDGHAPAEGGGEREGARGVEGRPGPGQSDAPCFRSFRGCRARTGPVASGSGSAGRRCRSPHRSARLSRPLRAGVRRPGAPAGWPLPRPPPRRAIAAPRTGPGGRAPCRPGIQPRALPRVHGRRSGVASRPGRPCARSGCPPPPSWRQPPARLRRDRSTRV
jgi:hypothetical protein